MRTEDKVKKKKKYTQIYLNTFFVFLLLLIIQSGKWICEEWSNVDFATIVFQLRTPLRGTNSEIVFSYIKTCLLGTVKKTVLLMFIYYFFRKICERIQFSFSFNFFRLEWQWQWKKSVYLWLSRVYIVALLLFLVQEIYGVATDLGTFEYIKSLNMKSHIFEDNYINPSDVSIQFPEEKRNLVLIYLESMEDTYASEKVGGGKPVNYIPELTQLAQSNINFSASNMLGGGFTCYGTGFTVGAIVGTSTGVPFLSPVEGNSMNKYAEFLPGITSLGEILQNEGYKNYFLCGSDASFGGRDLFYKKHGNYDIHDYYYAIEQGYIEEGYYVNWGYEDKKLYEIAKKELTELGKNGELFNYTMLTVDTHHPTGYTCELCGQEYDEMYANVVSCASRQAGDFIAWIQEQDWYENTTVVVLGDHISMVVDFWDDIGEYQRGTFNCFINIPREMNLNNVKNREFSTIDYFPTILASLDVKIEGERLGLGTNLFSNRKTLMEEMGLAEYNTELSYYSDYYVENFEKVKK